MKALIKLSLVFVLIAFSIASVGFLLPALSQTTVLGSNQAGTEYFKLTYDVITRDTTGTGIVYTPQCFECHLPINFSYSGSNAPNSVNLPLSKFAHTWNKFNSDDDINVIGVKFLVNQTFVSTFDNITKTCVDKTAVNGSTYAECAYTNIPYQVEGWRWAWKPLTSDVVLKKSEWYVIDFIAERTPRLGTYASDLIPNINSVELSNLAWFNSSYNKRVNFTISAPGDVFINADAQVVIPINWNTSAEISQGDLNSDGSDLTIVNGNGTNQLKWAWCEYDNPTYGINTANTCIFVKDVVTKNSPVNITLYYDNAGDTVFQNSSFNDTFSLRDNVKLLTLVYGGSNTTYLKDREEDTTSGTGEWTATSGTISNTTGLKVTAISVTAANLRSNTSNPWPNGDYTDLWWFKANSGIAGSAYIMTNDQGSANGGSDIRTNVAGAALYHSNSCCSALSIGSLSASQWYFGAATSTNGATGHVLSGFTDTGFIGRTAGTGDGAQTGVDRTDDQEPDFFGPVNFTGVLQIYMSYNGTLTSDEINMTWGMWNNNSLITKGNEETEGVEELGGNETIGRSAIEQGIGNSSISGAIVYTDQQIYVRYVNASQQLARFDKVTKSGNQIWAFNYFFNVSTPFTNMQNITPAFYVFEMANMSESDIRTSVSNLINKTRT